ncbi:general stress protein [Gloeobacter morelensis]|uniref:General stress protein n=1 Tax=Gloeobacter morelensis MG652769 TaxID=2781736 RepID=A0ABY3PIX3_9CYAN|nr:general stress protein [Gloeobacter morelensis]UFP93600.1 general stress protein [Gloeobacter morelensis MG652769]
MNVTGSGINPAPANEGVSAGSVLAGAFAEETAARQAIDSLSQAGYADEQILVAALERHEQDDLVKQTEAEPLNKESVATGGFGGALVEGFARLLPKGRGVANIVYSTLVRLGFTEEQARYYERAYEAGRILVVVEAVRDANTVLAILERHGADIGPGSTTGRIIEQRDTTVSTSGSTPPSTGPVGRHPDEPQHL